MTTELEIESQKSPEQIEREIDAQRASIGNIVDKLESKFTPGQMFDQAWSLMQNNGSTFVTNLGTSVRNNPVPAVLTSVGLLWLMMSQNRPPQPTYRTGPDQDTAGAWADGLTDGIDSARGHLHHTADSVKGGYESLKGGYESLKGKASHLGDNVSAASENLSHAMHDAGDRLSRNTQVLGQQFNQMLKEQPLVVAAAGIALGALLGAALPSTRTEQRYMGRSSAGLVDKVKKQAQEGYEAVRDTVTKTTEQAGSAGPAATSSGSATSAPSTPSTPSTSAGSAGSADLSKGLGTS
ncbi:Protein of uncharacterised function (DUF3618) [Pseudomonas fluorescens]|uniref:Protein of uncharacterized function (DUF3618) n=1 Tax=Pseudomonas fluorescens TaxID=294 RepID=A0A3S4P8Z2_PSEFL|nr:DUF3618 domain-containing protein [Pseudomonas fluorescens]VEF11612.1 Protein of uncharacterised function (DUF3618) [Pseudomonas fluorescens]